MTALATTSTALVLPSTVTRLEDNAQYTNRFDFISGSGSEYRVAQSMSGRWWSCSCPVWKFNKSHKGSQRWCKHLEAFGLPGGYTPHEVSGIQIAGSTPAALPAAPKASKKAKALPVPAVPAAAAPALTAANKPPKGGVVPLGFVKENGKLIVTFDEKDATAVFALLAALS